jgi:hypothetical protein
MRYTTTISVKELINRTQKMSEEHVASKEEEREATTCQVEDMSI